MKYCVLYPNTHNVNLVKDMGMIPYKLKEMYDFDSWIACYNNGDYPYLESDVKGLKIEFIEKKNNSYIMDGCRYLSKRAKEIDWLNIYHITSYSMAYAFLYKLLNKKGKIYLKLDCSSKLIERLRGMNVIERVMVDRFLSSVDIISAEQRRLIDPLKVLLKKHKEKIINISNGIDPVWISEVDAPKRKMFIHAGRLGSEEKNTEKILEGFRLFAEQDSEWVLGLVGPMESGFKAFLKEFLNENNHLQNRIEYFGEINDRKKYYSILNSAEALILNSDFESFAFVLIEAAFLTNYIISTDVGVAHELKDCCQIEILDSTEPKSIFDGMKSISKLRNDHNEANRDLEMVEHRYNYNNIIKKLKGYIDKNSNSCK